MSIKRFGFIFLLIFSIITVSAASERITEYGSEINVDENGVVHVKEIISWYCHTDGGKRGIFRDFPTVYTGRVRTRFSVPFKIISIKKNGAKEDYHTKPLTNGVRIYIGNENVFLKRGVYKYEIDYVTSRQIQFGGGEGGDDVFKWNVTGNDWAFPIEKAWAKISLPAGAPETFFTAYTGKQGEYGEDYTTKILPSGERYVETTKKLRPGEGITIESHFPAGYVKQPTGAEKMNLFFMDNLGEIIGLAGIILLLIYYLITWMRVGVDPVKGSIIPRFDPPENMEAGDLRYIIKMGYDKKIFTATIIEMAVKGYIRIEEDDDDYTLYRNKDVEIKEHFYKKIEMKLFAGADFIELSRSNYRRLQDTNEYIKKELKKKYNNILFYKNTGYSVVGFLLSGVILVGATLLSASNPAAIFLTVWLSIWNIGVFALSSAVFSAWKEFFTDEHKISEAAGAIFLTIFTIPFLGADIAVFYFFGKIASIPLLFIAVILIGLDLLFAYLLKRPTYEGRRIMDYIEGMKMYMSVAEKHWLNRLNPPEETPELFERLLPYAIALGVGNKWGERFNDKFNFSEADRSGRNSYYPIWYSSRSGKDFTPASFTSGMASGFSNAVSSSSAPASSGGSGGSGGGGGGGGGGSW